MGRADGVLISASASIRRDFVGAAQHLLGLSHIPSEFDEFVEILSHRKTPIHDTYTRYYQLKRGDIDARIAKDVQYLNMITDGMAFDGIVCSPEGAAVYVLLNALMQYVPFTGPHTDYDVCCACARVARRAHRLGSPLYQAKIDHIDISFDDVKRFYSMNVLYDWSM
jgi:hypothetical protein